MDSILLVLMPAMWALSLARVPDLQEEAAVLSKRLGMKRHA